MPRQIPLRDTPDLYGRITRFLHWSMAALILWQLVGMGLKLLLGRHPVASVFVRLHQPIGTILFILILLRIIWAFSNRKNRPAHGHGLIGIAARGGHMLLYLLILLVPSLGLLRAYGSKWGFSPFGFEIFAPKTPEIEWAVNLSNMLHSELAWIMAVMILGHVVMVAVHEAMWKDGTLARMLRKSQK